MGKTSINKQKQSGSSITQDDNDITKEEMKRHFLQTLTRGQQKKLSKLLSRINANNNEKERGNSHSSSSSNDRNQTKDTKKKGVIQKKSHKKDLVRRIDENNQVALPNSANAVVANNFVNESLDRKIKALETFRNCKESVKIAQYAINIDTLALLADQTIANSSLLMNWIINGISYKPLSNSKGMALKKIYIALADEQQQNNIDINNQWKHQFMQLQDLILTYFADSYTNWDMVTFKEDYEDENNHNLFFIIQLNFSQGIRASCLTTLASNFNSLYLFVKKQCFW